MAVLWGGASANTRVGAAFSVAMPGDTTYRIVTRGGLADPAASEVAYDSVAQAFHGLVGVDATSPGRACGGLFNCNAAVEGFFAGAQATRAGVAYAIGDAAIGGPNTADSIYGAAAFTSDTHSAALLAGPEALLGAPGASTLAYVINGSTPGIEGPGVAMQAADTQLDGFTLTASPGTFAPQRGTTIAAERGGNSLLAWGRWTLGTFTGPLPDWPEPHVARTFSSNQGLHYVVGAETPGGGLPLSGTATFNLLGATRPTWGDGALSPGTFTGSMAVQWGGASSTRVGADFSVAMPGDTTYRIMTSGGLADPAASEIAIVTGTARFSTGTGWVPVQTSSDGRPCPAAVGRCSSKIEGFFAGPNADYAGVAYNIRGPNFGYEISGAAAFAPDAPPATPPVGPVVLSAPAATTIVYAMNDFGMDILGPGAATQAADIQLNGYSLTASPASFAPQRGSATTAEGGGDSLITWGRWTGGTFTGPLSVLADPDARRTFNANQGLHYVVGAETPVGGLPLSGTATFNLLGATSPTWGDGAFAPGTFTGSMAVQWGGAASTTVGANFSVVMPGDRTYSIVTTGGLANPAASEIAIVAGTARFTGFMRAANPGGRAQCSAFCDVRVNGFFAGPAAERAGIAYTVGLGGSTAISGAAAFKKQ